MRLVTRVTWILGLMFSAFIVVGCSTPCKVIAKAGWTCGLEVVEPLKPGAFIYVKNGHLQRLAGNAPGFTTDSRPTNTQNETGEPQGTFDVNAGVEIPAASAA